MKKIIVILLVFSISLSMTNCASILNGKNQKVTVITGSSDSKVYVDGELGGTGKNVVVKMRRDASVRQIKIQREGYKPIYKVHYQTSKSPLYIMSWIPFGLLVYPPLLDFGPRSYNYKKTVSVPSTKLEIQKRKEDEKYVYLKNTAFDVKKEDIKYKRIKKSSYNKNKKAKNVKSFDEDIKFDNSIFSDAVSEILKANNYIDTTKTIFKSKTNTLYISSKVTKVDFQNIYENQGGNEKNYLVTKIELEWEIFDLYDQSKYKKSFKSESGEFKISYDKDSNYLKNSIEDAISESFYKFMDSKEVKGLIKQEAEEKIKFENLTLLKGNIITNMEEAMNATVTIKVKDGHGSGCAVSKDGYIITNFHVVSNAEKLTVVDRAGKEYTAKLIRKNENLDLALIKIEGSFLSTYAIPSAKNYSIGDDIFVIGTPTSVELGQTLSKGIISGNRVFDKNSFIQTDASVNGGNSGGAVTKKSGELIGIVNSKVSGVGVEGLGFAIPAEFITTGLYITN